MKKIYLLLIAFLLGSCKTVEATSTNQAKVYYHYKTIKPNLCLTFDDGPNTSQTLKVLDIHIKLCGFCHSHGKTALSHDYFDYNKFIL